MPHNLPTCSSSFSEWEIAAALVPGVRPLFCSSGGRPPPPVAAMSRNKSRGSPIISGL